MSDRAWRIETNGINAIPEAERHGTARELFSVWFAANISLLAVTYGGYLVVFYGLDLWQATAVSVVGIVVSFALVGAIGAAGTRAGAPTLVLSRSAFGVAGNALPALVSYITLIGFEIVSVSLAALATQTVLGRLDHSRGTTTLAVALVCTGAIAIGVGILGHATIVRVQKAITVVFAALTALFVGLEVPQIHWHRALSLPSGSLLGGMVGGLSIIMAGTGITWVNAAADYSRYLDRRSRRSSVVGWTVLGSSLPLVVLVVLGVLLAAGNPAIATSPNPIGTLAAPLPTWFLVPYLLTAVGGLVATVVMGSYSSGLNLLALGVRIRRHHSVVVDGALMAIGSIYLLFVSPSFFAPFEGFILTVSVPLSAWAGIFLVDRWGAGRDPGLLSERNPGRDAHDPELGDIRPGDNRPGDHNPGPGAGALRPQFHPDGGEHGALRPQLHAGGPPRGVNLAGVGSLVVASGLGLGLVTSTSAAFGWAGYLLPLVGGRTGAVGASSIGLLVAFASGGLLSAALRHLGRATFLGGGRRDGHEAAHEARAGGTALAVGPRHPT